MLIECRCRIGSTLQLSGKVVFGSVEVELVSLGWGASEAGATCSDQSTSSLGRQSDTKAVALDTGDTDASPFPKCIHAHRTTEHPMISRPATATSST